MNRIYSMSHKRNLSVVAINFKDGEKLNVQLTLLNNNFEVLCIVEDRVLVENYQAKYWFIPEKLAKSKGINPDDVAYIKGWIDANEDNIEDYEENVIYKVGIFDIVGIGHIENTNESYLITLQDLKEYENSKNIDIGKITKNPINEFPKNNFDNNIFSNFMKGFISVTGYLYAFGDFAARYTGFRDKLQCSNSVIDDLKCNYEKNKLTQDTKFTKKLIKTIIDNKYNLGDKFIIAVENYLKNNKEYIAGRYIGGKSLDKISPKIMNDKIILPKTDNFTENFNLNYTSITKIFPTSGSYWDFLYAIKNLNTDIEIEDIEDLDQLIDLFAEYIVKGQKSE